MASYFYANFVPMLLLALFVFQALKFSHSYALANVSCINAEREALLKFKQDLIDPSRNLASWTGEHRCEWEGVECSRRISHVVMLILNDCGLGGKIDPALSELRHLKSLRLANNSFNGHLPNQFGNLKHLRDLSLSFNSISGPIPSTIGLLSSLRYLSLFSNNLSGPIPSTIGLLSSLRYLVLSYNNLSGPIPSTIGLLSSLRYLYLSDNNLGGNIPESIGRLSKLEVMHFGNNQLNGVVNELHFANLTNLIRLSLKSNELIINVSTSWVPPFQIDYIDLSSCKVGPHFPNWLRTQRNIFLLSMSNASISSKVPHWLPDVLLNVGLLDLSSNMLRGNIFRIIGKRMPQSRVVSHSANNLSGVIPSSRCLLRNLQILDLSKNQLSGRLPRCLGTSLNSLRWISLGNNRLNGHIPSNLCGLENLKVLGLHKNGLSGVLPKCLLKLDLVILDVSDNLITGRIPPFSSGPFGVIDLSRNYFMGDIPLWLCQLHKLQYLSLAHNDLSGVIPPCFSNFSLMWANSTSNLEAVRKIPIIVNIKGRSLEFTSSLQYLFSIDLSSNALEGQISKGLTRLARLQNLNLSHNKLLEKSLQTLAT